MMYSSGRLMIDLDALARNFRRAREAASPSTCGAVVKADAYGLGIAPVAARLHAEDCRHFFVATAAEGAALRALLPSAAVYVLEGIAGESVDDFVASSLVPVLNSLEQIERWSRTGKPAVLHIDTGMNRLGLSAAEVERIAAGPALLDGMDVRFVMTHLACADLPEHPLNRKQIGVFDALRARLPDAPTTIGNSAGIFLGPDYRGDLVRPGIALYGGNPFTGRASPVEPVVTAEARVLQVRTLDERATVGYGATFAAAAGTRIAVVGAGYADGYPRSLSNRGVASVAGTRVPVAGRVSMDLVCVDVSALPAGAVREGTYVELFGHSVLLDDAAAAAGTISYELLTSLGARFEREYRGGTEP